jgi:hypothetical protein
VHVCISVSKASEFSLYYSAAWFHVHHRISILWMQWSEWKFGFESTSPFGCLVYFYARVLNKAVHFKGIQPWFARIIYSGHVLRMSQILMMYKTHLYHVNCYAASMYNVASVRSGICAVCAAIWYKMYSLCYWNNQLIDYSVYVGFRIRKLEGWKFCRNSSFPCPFVDNNFRVIIWMSCTSIVLNQIK